MPKGGETPVSASMPWRQEFVNTASNIATMKPKDLKRWTKREDVAEAVVFLASPAAAGITEQVITVTGWGL